GEHRGRGARVERVGPQRIAETAHDDRGLQTVADDVTDRGADMSRRELEQVVPVAADQARASRDVARRDLQAADVRQSRQEAALQGGGDPSLLLEHALLITSAARSAT